MSDTKKFSGKTIEKKDYLTFLKNPLLIGIILAIIQQFTGVNGYIFYSDSMVSDFHLFLTQ